MVRCITFSDILAKNLISGNLSTNSGQHQNCITSIDVPSGNNESGNKINLGLIVSKRVTQVN